MQTRQKWLRACAGLLLAGAICLTSLWVAAPRLAERQIRKELARLGVPVPNLHVRSVTPWALELEPVRLGTDPDAPGLGTLRVTYAPRELLRGKVRTVTLDGARLVVRRGKSGDWEVAGLDKLLPKRAASATPAKPLTPKEVLALFPGTVSIQNVSVIAETDSGRMEFPVKLIAYLENGRVMWDVSAEPLSLAGKGWYAHCDGAAIGGMIMVDKAEAFSFEAMMNLNGCVACLPGGRNLKLPRVEVNVACSSAGKMLWDGCLSNVSLHCPAEKLSMENLSAEFDLACAWPDIIRTVHGKVCINPGVPSFRSHAGGVINPCSWSFNGFEFGNVPIMIDIDGSSVHVTAHASPKLSHITVNVVAAADMAAQAVTFSATLPEVKINESNPAFTTFLARLPPDAREITFAATLGGKLDASWKVGEKLKGTAKLILKDGYGALNQWSVQDVKTEIGIDLGNMTSTATLTGRPGGSVLFVTAAVAANLEAQEAIVRATFPETKITEFDPVFTPFMKQLPPAMQGATYFSGIIGGKLDATWKLGGNPKGTGSLTLADGKFMLADGRGVSGVSGNASADLDANSAKGAFTVMPPGSALAATVAVSANLATREVAMSATVPPVAVSEKDPVLAPFLPPALKGAAFSGTVGGKADVTWKPGGEPKGTASLTLADGKFATADGKFDVAGVECGLNLESLVPLRSAPSQKLKFTAAHAAGTPLTDGKFAFRLDPPNTIFIEHGGFGWCGGRLTCAAARITGGKPDGMVMLRAEQIDAGQLLGLVKDFSGRAEGWLTGRIPLLFKEDGLRIGNVHLIGDPDKPGILQLDPEKWPGSQVDTLNVSPLVKQKMKQTLRDMSLSLLRLDAMPGNGQKETRLQLRFAGTPQKDSDLPPVDLTLNLNIEDSRNLLWDLLNQSLQLK